ncbi:MAG: sel1 repeat family protein [Gammaproteobacteria bacterium]|nr:sel1 repeat family protein [Gammaproteobacteria bacterium]MDH5799385.1 sel1 repeat family protein [Gammaproteobacteria bacterium]
MQRLKHIRTLFKYVALFFILNTAQASNSPLPSQNEFNDNMLLEAQTAFNQGQHEKALRLWQSLAQQGHSGAQVLVGLAYMNAWGVLRNESMAEQWYLRAADADNLSAQYLLGLLYIGRSDLEQAREGVRWLKRAADKGDLDAARFLNKARKNRWLDHINPQLLSAHSR